MRRYALLLALSSVLLLTLVSCQPWYEREPLEVIDPRTVRVRLDVNWKAYFGEEPSGMTLVLYDDDNKPVTTVSSSVNSIYLDHLEIGHYRLVLFNKGVNDFPSIHFENMNIYEKMTARATTFKPSRYTAWTQGETFTYDPEILGTLVEEFDITEEMLLKQSTFYPYKEWIKMMGDEAAASRVYRTRTEEDVYIYVIEVFPQPVVTRLYVRVHITNIRNMSTIEGFVTGFADGWMLTEAHSTTNGDTRYLLDKWTVTDDAELSGDGWAVTSTTLWGEPHGLEYRADRRNDQNRLVLHLTLRDGTTVDYLYNVGQEVRYVTHAWGDEWSYTDLPTRTMVVTIWDRDPGNDPGQPDDPGGITPDPDKPRPDPDDPGEPLDPDNPNEPVLPDVEGKDESGKTGFGIDVNPWQNGEKVVIPI